MGVFAWEYRLKQLGVCVISLRGSELFLIRFASLMHRSAKLLRPPFHYMQRIQRFVALLY